MRLSTRESPSGKEAALLDHGIEQRPRTRAIRRFLRNRAALTGAVIIGILTAIAILSTWIVPQDPYAMNMAERLQAPSSAHWFGTDSFGRDLLSRLMLGARLSLAVGVGAVAGALVLGVTLGLISGYFGGWIDLGIMRMVDIFLAFPAILLALMFVAALGPSTRNVVIAIALISWTTYARLVRASTLSTREQDYITAARVIGAGSARILWSHILPNVIGPIIVVATLGLGTAIIAAASLSFLGLGTQPPTPDWGSEITVGMNYLRENPWLSTFPGLAIMVTVLGFNLVGDGLRDLLDPHQLAS